MILEVVATILVMCGPQGSAGLEAELRGYYYVSQGTNRFGKPSRAYVTDKKDGVLFPMAFTYSLPDGRECLLIEGEPE